ncbi:MAG: NnrS family protein [Gammaproteobacteria bacterium]|nr:MAG: NnrS family protein [Gammaproteobacteria bacterium]
MEMNRFPAALWQLGFRPFFLLAGIVAVVEIGVWMGSWHGAAPVGYYPGALLHAHEILFGYTVAVVSGFLLTAVRNWTGQPTPSGVPLILLAGLWLAGRLLPWLPVPPLLTALTDLAFLPALMAALIPPLVRGNKPHHLMFVVILGVMAVANLLVHAEILGESRDTARPGVYLAAHLVLLLITLLGGRVIPLFTRNGLLRHGVRHEPRTHPLLERLTLYGLIAWIALRLQLDSGWPLVLLSVVVGVAQLARLSLWWHRAVLREPLLWILFAGYGWMGLGFLLTAAAASGWLPLSTALHAFTAGGIGAMTLGMMTRVALGHTGRELSVGRPIVAAYLLLNLAALLRVAGPLAWPEHTLLWLDLAGGCWILAFLLFLAVYAPILTHPRVDAIPPRQPAPAR